MIKTKKMKTRVTTNEALMLPFTHFFEMKPFTKITFLA